MQSIELVLPGLTAVGDIVSTDMLSPPPPQGGQWLSRRHVARLGYRDGSVFTRPDGPRGGGALRPVRRPAGGQRCLRLHGESVGPRDGDLPPHAAGPHQQSVLVTGEPSTERTADAPQAETLVFLTAAF